MRGGLGGLGFQTSGWDFWDVTTWSLRGPRGNDTLARVLERGLVESVDSLISRGKMEEFSCPVKRK
jgi:hypothetical protein